ncbi:MAG: hypothetical protein ACFWUD_00160 [Thermocaproicibacter melissae]
MGLQTSKVIDKLILSFCCTASFLAIPRFGRSFVHEWCEITPAPCSKN